MAVRSRVTYHKSVQTLRVARQHRNLATAAARNIAQARVRARNHVPARNIEMLRKPARQHVTQTAPDFRMVRGRIRLMAAGAHAPHQIHGAIAAITAHAHTPIGAHARPPTAVPTNSARTALVCTPALRATT